MEESNLKVILLGFDGTLLKNVTDRVNDQRPVEVSYCTDLKEFLAICVEQQPDLVGVSVSYPHQRAAKFPKIFKMALNTPVLTFGENQDFKTRKALSTSVADLKIQGVITAHNLWMKIVNFQRMKEEELEKLKNGKPDKDGALGPNSVFLKDRGGREEENKNSVLNKLFSALDGTNQPSDSSSTSNSNDDRDNDSAAAKASKDSLTNRDINKDNESSSLSVNDSGRNRNGTSNSSNGPGYSHVSGGSADKKPTSSSSLDKVNQQSAKLNGVLDDNLNGENSNNPKEIGGDAEESRNSTLNSSESSIRQQKAKSKGILDLAPDKSKKPKDQSGKAFGKVQLADAKEVDEDAKKKDKEKSKREQARQKNVLETASEFGLEKVFKAPRAKEIKRFSSQKIAVFTVDLGKIKGYLMLTTIQDADLEAELLEFKKVVVQSLKEQNTVGDISHPYIIDFEVKNYIASVAEFTEFNVNHQNQNGTYFNVAFVQREMLLPTLSESDKSDMYFVDIKVIPPQTPVTFDAFIYLPRNKRFVRYLKEGRTLSLKQAKRHSEEDGQSQLYLPKDHKRQFELFYIKNTLSWEFALHNKTEVA